MKKVINIFIGIDIILILLLIASFLCPEFIKKEAIDILRENNIQKDKPIILSNDKSDLFVDTIEHKYSDNKYEEDIINHEPNNNDYKLLTMKIDGYNSFLLVVYDPATVKLMVSKAYGTPDNSGIEKILKMTERYGAVAGINGGRFFDNGKVSMDIPIGYVIKDGKIVYGNPNRKGELIAFTYDNRLSLIKATGEEAIKAGVRDAIEFGPYLIIDGEETVESKQIANKRASRVVIAQRNDGIVLMLVTDGESYNGPRMLEIMNVLKQYGAVNAANLDGGASSQLVIEGNIYNYPKNSAGNAVRNGRAVINGWGVFLNNK